MNKWDKLIAFFDNAFNIFLLAIVGVFVSLILSNFHTFIAGIVFLGLLKIILTIIKKTRSRQRKADIMRVFLTIMYDCRRYEQDLLISRHVQNITNNYHSFVLKCAVDKLESSTLKSNFLKALNQRNKELRNESAYENFLQNGAIPSSQIFLQVPNRKTFNSEAVSIQSEDATFCLKSFIATRLGTDVPKYKQVALTRPGINISRYKQAMDIA